jgi:hypothetical protein
VLPSPSPVVTATPAGDDVSVAVDPSIDPSRTVIASAGRRVSAPPVVARLRHRGPRGLVGRFMAFVRHLL